MILFKKWTKQPIINPRTARRIQPIPREKKGRESLAKLRMAAIGLSDFSGFGSALSPSAIAAKSVKAVVI